MTGRMNPRAAKILVFGGTSEGRALLAAGLPCLYSAASEYGAELAQDTSKAADNGGQEIISGRLDSAAIAELAARGEILGVVDATHPYAAEVGANILFACQMVKKPLFRISRAPTTALSDPQVLRFTGTEEAANYLAQAEGNMLVVTGSKEMRYFTAIPDYQKRVYFRVLPTSEVIAQCEKLGVPASRIIAEQGPFSELANRAHIERAQAAYLVTKDGGPQGGMAEKLEAASACGVKIILITRPEETKSYENVVCGNTTEALDWALDLLGMELTPHTKKPPMFPLFVDLAGKPALIVGGGEVALRKAKTLLRCCASLRVVAPYICDGLRLLAAEGGVSLIERVYEGDDVRGAALVVAATDEREVNRKVGADAAGLPVNVADCPEECTFFFPAFIEYDGYAAGVSSSGQSPAASRALAAKLREVWKDWVIDVTDKA